MTNEDTEALSRRFPLRTQAVVTAALLFFGVLHAQTRAQRNADEKTLDTAYAAREQADDFVNVLWGELLNKAVGGELRGKGVSGQD